MSWQKRQGIMLCQPLDEHNLARNKKLSGQMIAQPKLDGQRAWVMWNEDEPILVSSTGDTIYGVPHINLALKELAKGLKERRCYDGELYVHREITFEEILSRTKRLPNNLHSDYTRIQYWIFDYKSEEPQGIRIGKLASDLSRFQFWTEEEEEGYIFKDILKSVPYKILDIEQVVIEEQLNTYVQEGYEGIILRNPLPSYEERRPFTCLKWKPSKKDSYKIIDVHQAISQEGIPLGMIGSLDCEDRYGNTFSVGCGLGLTEGKKRLLWDSRQDLIGKYALVSYQNLTKYGVPRFGKFTEITITETLQEEW